MNNKKVKKIRQEVRSQVYSQEVAVFYFRQIKDGINRLSLKRRIAIAFKILRKKF